MSIETTSPEDAVLGAILTDGVLIRDARDEGLRPKDFESQKHRVIYAAMIEMHERREAIDPLTIERALRDAGTIEEAGGAAYLSELPDRVAMLAHVREHARIVKEAASEAGSTSSRRRYGTFAKNLPRRRSSSGTRTRRGIRAGSACSQARGASPEGTAQGSLSLRR